MGGETHLPVVGNFFLSLRGTTPGKKQKQKKHTTLEALIFLIKKTPSALNEW
jgi:hypothetical protein